MLLCYVASSVKNSKMYILQEKTMTIRELVGCLCFVNIGTGEFYILRSILRCTDMIFTKFLGDPRRLSNCNYGFLMKDSSSFVALMLE